MDHVRLVMRALAPLLALAACDPAGAQTSAASSGVVVPPGWQPLPQLAAAARDAAGAKGTVDGAEAWGQTAMGCYAVWIAMSAPGAAPQLADQVLAAFAAPPARDKAAGGKPGDKARAGDKAGSTDDAGDAARVDIKDVVKPTADPGVLSLAFERAPYRGRMVARLGGGKMIALACFANQREPVACEAACAPLLGALP